MRRKWVNLAGALVVVSGFAFIAVHWVGNALLPRRGSLTFPEQVDLGAVEQGKELEASFTIKNQSAGPVLLSDFAGNCSCMGLFQPAPSGPEPLGSVLLNAGQELVVGARFAAPGAGTRVFAHRVTFTADPPPPQPPSVLLTGTVQIRMYAEPSSVSWGPLRPHQAAEQVVRLVDLRKPPERTPFALVSDHGSVKVESVEEVEGTEQELSPGAVDGQVYRVKLKVQAGAEGEVSGSVHVRCGDEKTTIHSIRFYASVVPAVRLVPPTLVFPRPGSADPFSGRVLLRSNSPCQLVLGPAPKGFRLEQAGKFLVVRCDPDALPGPGKHTLTVHAKAADGATHRLTLTVVIAHSRPADPEG
jgi:hypothetical protein